MASAAERFDREHKPLERPAREDPVQACKDYLAGLDGALPRGAFQRLVLQSKRSAAEATLGWLQAYARELEDEVVRT